MCSCEWPERLKCLATGLDRSDPLFLTSSKCSQKRSPNLRTNWNDLSVLSTLSIRPSNSDGKSLKPQSLFSISTFLSKTTNWQPVSTTNPQIRTVTYCTRLPTHLTSKTQFRTPNFSDSVDSAAKIQTLTPNATKCRISFLNVAILTASCLKHSIVSKTSKENPL